METIKRYRAPDGMTFDNRFDCARWEFSLQPDLLDKLMDKLKGKHITAQGNWCGGDPEERSGYGACACMGCANHAFYDLGLEYPHWKVWFEELRGDQPTDHIPNSNTDVDIILQDVGPNRIEVFKALRLITGLGVLETKNLMEKPNAAIQTGTDFYYGKKYLEELTALGATIKLEVSQSQRWTRVEYVS